MHWTPTFWGDECLVPQVVGDKLVLELLGETEDGDRAFFLGGKKARATLLGVSGEVGFRRIYFDLAKLRRAWPDRTVFPGELALLVKERGGCRGFWTFRGDPMELRELLDSRE